MEYAPQAILELFHATAAACHGMTLELGGVLGDQAHTYGYHRARAVLPDDDYSVLLRRDQHGDQWAASALDITPAGPSAPAAMRQLTARVLLGVQSGDRRLYRAVREVYGTLDGRKVWGWDMRFHHAATSDASHLWHLHLSFYRVHATNAELLLPVAEVLAGR